MENMNTKAAGKTTVATSRWTTSFMRGGFVLVRATFDFMGKSFVAIETTTRQIEVYDHYPDGMERFIGYVGNPALSAVLVMAAIEALCSRPAVRL